MQLDFQVTRDCYFRRMRVFFNFINLVPNETWNNDVIFLHRKQWNILIGHLIISLDFYNIRKDRVENEEITGATLRNFVKAIKLFCEMSDIPIQWKKITRGLPKIKKIC